jgi:chemotaxis methyl-accepting protein methylase
MTFEACVAIILALECSPEKAKQRKRKQYWMQEWFKKRVTFSNQNLLQELLALKLTTIILCEWNIRYF